MPSRGSYQFTSASNTKAVVQDQSYRSCLLALIVFFFLCVILILASLPWKRGHVNYSEHHEEQEETEGHHHYHHHEDRIEETTTTKSVSPNTVIIFTETKEPTSEFEKTTEEYHTINFTNEATNSSKFAKLLNIETTTTEDILSTFSVNDSELTTDYQLYDNRSTINTNTTESVILTTERTEETTVDEWDTHTTRTSTYAVSSSTDLNFRSSEMYETTSYNISEITIKNESTTIESTTESHQDTPTHFITTSTEEDNTLSAPLNTSSTVDLVNEQVCTTGECKNIASKMLFYMNHTIDPCEDFYEYACGGFEANSQTVEQDLENMAYQRILKQMQKENRKGKSSLFTKYYNSCLQYKTIEINDRKKLAKQMLDKIGKFYTIEGWTKNHTSFTELVAKLLLHNSPLLFDVSPDLDEYSPKQFTLKIGPSTYKNIFNVEDTNDDSCYASQFEREQNIVDLGNLYKKYKTCKNNTKKFIRSISNALTALRVFDELDNIPQNINTTVINIDLEIVQKFFSNYPSQEKIREAYLMKNYTRVTVETLDKNYKVVNWTQLIRLLTGELVKPEVQVQIYFYDVLAQGLKSLEVFKAEDPIQLNNALLGLYAHNLYHELVLLKQRNDKEYCLRVATNLLIPEASELYISSFSRDQLAYMNKTIHNIFNELKETLKINIKEVEWVTLEWRNALIAKIDDLKVALPDISYLTDSKSIYRLSKADEVILSDNYFENSVTLMQRYRKLIYAELYTNPGHPEQIWTHYATPFQSKGLAIYGLNLVVIPFGVIDWATRQDKFTFDYIELPILGNVIAYQIAHHFDANGIYYWNGTRDTENSLLKDNEDYINNQRNIFYQNAMNMTISSTGQTVTYEILQLSLNERLSEAVGLRLAYDTLDRLRSPEEVHLPWLKLNFDQLFYLTYAQMHCTKLPLTSSYISLYENEQLPSRIRIFVSASNNRLLGKAWDCPDGSQIMPSYTCSPFPYLRCNDVTEETDT